MRGILGSVGVVCVLAGSPLLATGALALEVGEPAPRVELASESAPLSVPSARARLTYVDFWASWCSTCRQSFPWMNALQHKYGADGLDVIAVNLDAEAADAAEFLAKNPAQFTVAYDPEGITARRFGVKGMPTSVLIDADGKVLAVHTGFKPADGEALEATIRQALGTAP